MASRFCYFIVLGLFAGVTVVSAQPGPMSTAKNSPLIFPASTLVASFRAISANSFAATTGTAASITIVEIVFTPTITQTIAHATDQIIISGGGGLVGASYHIVTTTNVALPADQWTPIVSGQFNASGGFNYTNVILPNTPGQFFRVVLP